ncbi:MAG: chromate efflux transporter [Desulfobacteraceae bacterium]|jgi:chromate transporter
MLNTPTFFEAFIYWLKLGFISFGGPAGQIAIMHKDLVDEKKWIDDDHFLQALNYCMLLPGPEAQQLTVYIGWLLHGHLGGIIAGVLFVLPAVLILLILSYIYAAFGNIPAVDALFYGLKPSVAAIVAEAVIRMGKKSLKSDVLILIAILSFIGIYFAGLPFPLIILIAGLSGFVGSRVLPAKFIVNSKAGATKSQNHMEDDQAKPRKNQATWQHTLKVIAVCVPLWFLPMILLGLYRGWDDIFMDIGILFSKAAMVTFGGAYAVLAYISQQAVSHYGWMLPEQMMDGLGLAETTPGPLIMVTQFVGFFAAYTHAKGMSPLLAGLTGGLLTTWVTFVPCFMWVLVGAPYIEKLRNNKTIGAALSGITAAVVGVILNLCVIFTYHVVMPNTGGIDIYAICASLVFFVGLIRFKWGMIPVVFGSAFAGYLWKIVLSHGLI